MSRPLPSASKTGAVIPDARGHHPDRAARVVCDPAAAVGSVDVEAVTARSFDLLRPMLPTFVDALPSADADAVCGANQGQSSPQRVASRNGYRCQDFDTRTGTIDVATPPLRTGTYFPDWLLTRRKRAERAPDVGGGHQLHVRGLHPADGTTGGLPGDHLAVQAAGVADGTTASRCQVCSGQRPAGGALASSRTTHP